MTVSLTDTTLEWRGTTMHGRRGPGRRHVLSFLDGWGDWQSPRREEYDRPQEHGTRGAAPLAGARVVRTGGMCRVPAERDAMLAELEALFGYADPDAPPEELTITHAGRTLTAMVYVTRYQAPMDLWGAGKFRWRVEFIADDPLRYGTPVPVSTLFPTLRGGLEYDLYTDGAGADLGYLDYGLASDTGRLVVTNTGTAPAPVLFQVEGEVAPQGFDIAQVSSDRRLRFVGPNSATSVLVLDGATGNVLVDGTADRGGQLTYRDWPLIPAATLVAGVLVPSSIELAFINLGATSPARLTAVVRPGSW